MTSFDGRILFLEMPILATQEKILSKKKASTLTTSVSAENAPLEKIIMKNRLELEASNLGTIALSAIVLFDSENLNFIY